MKYVHDQNLSFLTFQKLQNIKKDIDQLEDQENAVFEKVYKNTSEDDRMLSLIAEKMSKNLENDSCERIYIEESQVHTQSDVLLSTWVKDVISLAECIVCNNCYVDFETAQVCSECNTMLCKGCYDRYMKLSSGPENAFSELGCTKCKKAPFTTRKVQLFEKNQILKLQFNCQENNAFCKG